MKKFIRICALTGLILLLAGIGITSVSAAMGGRYSSFIPHHIWARIWDGDDYLDNYWDDLEYSDDLESSGNWSHWNEEELHSSTGGNGLSAESAARLTESAQDAALPPEGSAASSQDPGAADNSGRNLSSFTGTRKLDVDMDNGVVRIYEKEDISQIEVNVYDEYNSTRCYMDKETLKIKRENKRRRADDVRVEVLIPAGYQFEKVSVDMGAAECQINGIHTSKLDIDTGVGAVVFSGTVTGNVELETGVGDVALNIKGRESDYNYRIECGVGTIQVGESSYTMMSHENHINNNAPYTMELECGVGTVTVSFDES